MNEKIRIPLVAECSMCITKSLGNLIPLLTDNEKEQFRLHSLAFERLATGFERRIDPARLSISIYKELYEEAGNFDPYSKLKQDSKVAAEKVFPIIDQHVSKLYGYEKLCAALAASITGNIIDFNTAGHDPDLSQLEVLFEQILEQGFSIDDSQLLWNRLNRNPGKAVFLADNVGETLFDIPLLQILNELGWKIIYVVKGQPMINDATEDDVRGTKIEELAEIQNTGAWAFGVPKELVNEEFIKLVEECDLAISKGQANIETFPEIQEQVGIESYYVLRGKCEHITGILGISKGDNVVLRKIGKMPLEDNV